jgi:hypothetical protein
MSNIINFDPFLNKFSMFMTHATNNNILKNGITPVTYFVKSLRSTNYDVFSAINYRYVAALSMPVSVFNDIIKNPESSQAESIQIISHDEIRLNYQQRLSDNATNIRTFSNFTSGEVSKVRSLQSGTNGPTLGEYAGSVKDAVVLSCTACPVDMNKIESMEPVFYLSTYNILNIETNTTSPKTSQNACMKYVANGQQRILLVGVGVTQPV